MESSVLWLPLDDWRAERDFVPDPNHHVYAWTPRLLATLLREAGFEVRDCRVVTHAWSLRYARLWLPERLFDALCWVTAVVGRRRQLEAVALSQ